MAWQAVQFDDAAHKRIQAAAALEKRLRLNTYLQLDADLAWCKVRQITPKDCVVFEIDENRLFTKDRAQIDDFIHFAFALRVNTKESPKKCVKRLIRQYRANKDAIQKTIDFVNQSFIDCPASKHNEVKAVDTGLWLPSMVDTFASEYGWSVDYVMNQPIKMLFLQMQQIYKRNMGKKFSVSNPITQQARANELKRLKDG